MYRKWQRLPGNGTKRFLSIKGESKKSNLALSQRGMGGGSDSNSP